MAFMQWKNSPEDTAIDPAVEAAKLLEEKKKARDLFTTNISANLRSLWETAKRGKIPQETKMIKWLRARNGQYDPQKLAAIRQVMGATAVPIYMNLTETKCRASEAWVKDMIFVPGHRPFSLEPTPVPELPAEMIAYIENSVQDAVAQEVAAAAMATGIMLTPEQMSQAYQQALPMMKSQIDAKIKESAKKAAEYMSDKIADQFVECKWEGELSKTIYDMVTFGTGILKGPCLRRSDVWKRSLNPATGMFESVIEERIIPKWERVNPFDWYPSPDATSDNIIWGFHRIRLSRKQISDLIGVDGYKEDEIRAVLQEFSTGGLREWLAIDSTKAELEGRDAISMWASELIDCLEYAGSASGKALLKWGLTPQEVPDPDKEYNIIAWLIGNHVVRCVLNPDLGSYFYACGFSMQPDTVWHKGVPELIEHIQILANACARAIVHNVAVASGPLVEINVDRLEPGETAVIWPWKVTKTTSQGMMESPAVKYWQPNMITERLLQVFEFCLSAADDDSGIPRYAHTGETRGGGAGETASGLSMLMGHASKGVKLIVKNLDDGIIIPCVEAQYHYNLRYDGDDEKIIGDLRPFGRGSTAMIAKEQQVVRTIEMLDRTNNPVDLQLIGLKGRAELMRPALVGLGIDVDKVLGDEEAIDKRAQEMQMQQEQMQAPGNPSLPAGTPEGMKEVDSSGTPVKGHDTGTFASPEGSKP